MSTILGTDLFLVQRGTTLYQVAAVDLKEEPVPPPASRPWTPADIPSNRLAVWLDASDPLTVSIAPINQVSEWRSKAPTGNPVFSNGTSAMQPAWDGSGWVGTAAGGGGLRFVQQQGAAIVAPFVRVEVYQGRNANSGSSFGMSGNFDGSCRLDHHAQAPGEFRLSDAQDSGAFFSPLPVEGSIDVVTSVFDVSSVDWLIRLNGLTGTPRARPAFTAGSNVLRVGMTKKAQCVVILGSRFSDSTLLDFVQRTEGWAAHKYGIANKLPADHPYRAAPPLT